MPGQLLIISGPSGAGKSSLCAELFKARENIYFSISSTTRAKREGEIDGVHYKFIGENAFMDGIKGGIFLEWARVHNNYYGTEKSQVDSALAQGKIVVFDIDIQGQKSLKSHYPNATSIFITTPNQSTLESRLKARALDSEAVISERLNLAFSEMQSMGDFDFVIINDDFSASLRGFLGIVDSLRFRNSAEKTTEILSFWQR